MLPIVDYGAIAIVVPNINAVGNVGPDDEKFGFEVYMTGMNDPLVIGFDSLEEAEEAREELVAIIAQFHYTRELGPDFDVEDLEQDLDDDGNGDGDKH